jgi:hypothetical protein
MRLPTAPRIRFEVVASDSRFQIPIGGIELLPVTGIAHPGGTSFVNCRNFSFSLEIRLNFLKIPSGCGCLGNLGEAVARPRIEVNDPEVNDPGVTAVCSRSWRRHNRNFTIAGSGRYADENNSYEGGKCPRSKKLWKLPREPMRG